ncbi:hypothetical protein EDD86DRAFT_247016 [Gorgonomyces haynaldii]|nr:hypothetical protein EDD86DRAFT_247016 [Gorgonomyces haynaldii]
MHPLNLLFSQALLASKDFPESLSTLPKSSSIAIVGGGVSGLSAARTLTQHGFSNVVVFEKGSTVVPVHHAVKPEQAVYDLDLIYIPALNWKGVGVDEEYLSILREYKQPLISRMPEFFRVARFSDDKPDAWDLDDDVFSKEKTLKQTSELVRFTEMYAAFYRNHSYDGVHECLNHGLAWKNESFGQWAVRNDFPLIRDSIVKLLALYGNMPVENAPACQILFVLANKGPSMLGTLMGQAADQPDFDASQDYDPLLLSWIASVTADRSKFVHRLVHGYGKFFSAIALQERIDYRLGAEVTKLTPLENQVQVQTKNGNSEKFDVVIVSGRPTQVAHVLPESHPMQSLYQVVSDHAKELRQKTGIYGVAVVRCNFKTGTYAEKGTFRIDYMPHLEPMERNIVQPGVSVMRVIHSTTDEPYVTVTWYAPEHLVNTEQEKQQVFEIMNKMNMIDLELIRMQHYWDEVTRVPIDQVADGCVPTAFLHAHHWILSNFGLEDKPRSVSTEVVEQFDLMPSIHVNKSSQAIGYKVFEIVSKRPIDAIRIGLHPALLVDNAFDTAATPAAVFVLMMVEMFLLRGFEFAFRKSDKRKKLAIYSTEILLTSFILYALELFYQPEMRPSLFVHHLVTVVLYMLMHAVYAGNKTVFIMRMSLNNLLNGITEQSVFLLMLLHRLYPSLLAKNNWIARYLANYYLISRFLFGAMAISAWLEFVNDGKPFESWNNVGVLCVYPLILITQMVTQADCYVAQRNIWKQYLKKAE